MPATDLELLVAAARASGEIARRFFRRQTTIWEKAGDEGPVTEADLAVNEMLKAELLAARPDYGWLSEETPDSRDRLEAESVFIVDPIDGTRAFIKGDTNFAHALAVAREGTVTAAVVYLPIEEALYAAEAGGAAMLNGQPIRVSARHGTDGATVLGDKAAFAPEHWRGGVPEGLTRRFGPAMSLRLCRVAEGSADATISLGPAWEWDIAAGDLIARQAGAEVSDRTGRRVRYNSESARSNGILAAPVALWQTVSRPLAV